MNEETVKLPCWRCGRPTTNLVKDPHGPMTGECPDDDYDACVTAEAEETISLLRGLTRGRAGS